MGQTKRVAGFDSCKLRNVEKGTQLNFRHADSQALSDGSKDIL